MLLLVHGWRIVRLCFVPKFVLLKALFLCAYGNDMKLYVVVIHGWDALQEPAQEVGSIDSITSTSIDRICEENIHLFMR